jgi:alkanesulfonate monooxygenase SsuD/methylene tetrahydromethanopterin reductase-like flavin-dependent oxidoreductase (luciferase family)
MASVVTSRQSLGLALRDVRPWGALADAVREAERLGYERVFLPEIPGGRDAPATLSALADVAQDIGLATGVLPMSARTPLATAMLAATLQERARGRFVLGLGTGAAGAGALERLRTLIDQVRGLLAGDRVDIDGRPVRLSAPPQAPPPIWMAALGPRAVAIAGAVADGVLLNWCTPERVARARTQLAEAARAAGRDPGSVTVAAYVRACLVEDEGAALAAMRVAAGEYAAIPAYRHQAEAMGLGPGAEEAARTYRAGRPQDVPEDFVRALGLLGDPAAARARIARYREMGLDLPVIYPVAKADVSGSTLATLRAMAAG